MVALPSNQSAVYDVVGCGAIAERAHLPVLQYLSRTIGVRVRGCFDVDRNRARRLAEKLAAGRFGVPEEIGDTEEVSLALVAVPPAAHAAAARYYLERGCAALVEKPFAASAAEAAGLVETARARRTAVFVVQMRRFFSPIQIARGFMKLELLGKVRRVDASEGVRYFWQTASTYVVESPFGGVILDTGSHVLDAVLFVLGIDQDLDDFRIASLNASPPREPSHACQASLEIDSRRLGRFDLNLRLSRLEQIPHGIRIYGERGVLVVPNSEASRPLLVGPHETIAIEDRGGGRHPYPGNSAMLAAHLDAIRAHRSGGVGSVLAGERFLQQMRILDSLTARSQGTEPCAHT